MQALWSLRTAKHAYQEDVQHSCKLAVNLLAGVLMPCIRHDKVVRQAAVWKRSLLPKLIVLYLCNGSTCVMAGIVFVCKENWPDFAVRTPQHKPHVYTGWGYAEAFEPHSHFHKWMKDMGVQADLMLCRSLVISRAAAAGGRSQALQSYVTEAFARSGS